MKKIMRKIAVFVLIAMAAAVPLQATVGNAAGESSNSILSNKNYAQFVKMVMKRIQAGLQSNQYTEIVDERTPLSGPEPAGEGDAPQISEEQAITIVEEVQEVVETVVFEAPAQTEPVATFAAELPEQSSEPEIDLPAEQESSVEQTITMMPTEEHDVSGILHEEPLSTGASPPETTESATDEPLPDATTEPLIEHTVIYVDQDDLFLRTLLVEDGDTLQLPQSIPELEGHTFLYWFEIEAGLVPYEFGTPVYRNMILKPLFEEDEIATPTEVPVADEPAADVTEPDEAIATADNVPPKSEHEVVGVIKGDDGLEILIVKDPTETESTVVTEDEAAGTPEAEQSLEPTATPDEPATIETEDASTEDAESTDPTTETASSEEPTSEDTSTGEPTTEEDGGTEEDPATTEESDDPTPEPTVELVFDYETDDENGLLVEGSVITVTAVLSNFPEDEQLLYQWQNNADGEFVDVPGATELSYSFVADEHNTGCSWRIKVTVVEPEASAAS